jgi:flagellar protein FliO/FliZ
VELTQYLQFVLALVFVLALIWALASAARRYGLAPGATGPRGGPKRLSITEVATVDAKRRLVLVRRDNVEHLILLGISGDVIIESGISAPIRTAGATDAQTPTPSP